LTRLFEVGLISVAPIAKKPSRCRKLRPRLRP